MFPACVSWQQKVWFILLMCKKRFSVSNKIKTNKNQMEVIREKEYANTVLRNQTTAFTS